MRRDGENEAFAGEAVLEVLRHGGGGHEEANAGAAGAQGLAEKIEDMGGFAGAGGSREQTHRLQCSAGRRKTNEGRRSVRFLCRGAGDVTNIEQSWSGRSRYHRIGKYQSNRAGISHTGLNVTIRICRAGSGKVLVFA